MGRRRVQGSAATTEAAIPVAVPVTAIALNPRNPRDSYEDISDLTASIEEVGILQPLGVVRYETFLTHYPEHEHEVSVCDWVVLNGNRRLAAARKAGLEEVPVHVLDRLGRDEQLDESVLIENIHRQALPPLREATALQTLLERHGSQRSVAKRIGKSQGYISQRLSLLDLVPALQAALTSGDLTVERARKLASLPATQQCEVAEAGPPHTPPEAEPSDYGVITPQQEAPEADYAVITEHEPATAVPASPPAQKPRDKRQPETRDLAATPAMVIRVQPHAPDQLAAAIRQRLEPHEIQALVRLLAAG